MNSRLVFVALGTDHHPFDRLLSWASQLATEDPSVDWFIQSGSTRALADLDCIPMLAVEDLEAKLSSARVVVTHGGPGLILEASAHGHVPIVVPRDPQFAEHVDNHQLLFTQRLADAGRVRRVTNLEDFRVAVGTALTSGPRALDSSDSPSGQTVARFTELVDALVAKPGRHAR